MVTIIRDATICISVTFIRDAARIAHTALHYLCPHDYYHDDPAKLLAERETKLRQAGGMRREYWEEHRH
jgi:hypothetical protein